MALALRFRPPAHHLRFDNAAARTIGPNSGTFTAVAAGTANITDTDSTNSLSATFQFIVQTQAIVAQSATLDYTIDRNAHRHAQQRQLYEIAGTIKKL